MGKIMSGPMSREISSSEEEVCIPCKTNENPVRTLMKYVWNLSLTTSYLMERGFSDKCDHCDSTCPDLASYLFLWAVTLWLCGRNLTPPCLTLTCRVSPFYHFVAIPVLSSVVHRQVWTELITFLKAIEFIVYNAFADGDDPDYQSVFDPALTVSLSDIIALATLAWVLKSYAIIDCVISLINRLIGCPAKPIPCIRQNETEEEDSTF